MIQETFSFGTYVIHKAVFLLTHVQVYMASTLGCLRFIKPAQQVKLVTDPLAIASFNMWASIVLLHYNNRTCARTSGIDQLCNGGDQCVLPKLPKGKTWLRCSSNITSCDRAIDQIRHTFAMFNSIALKLQFPGGRISR